MAFDLQIPTHELNAFDLPPVCVNVLALFRPGGKTRAGAGLGLSLVTTGLGVVGALAS